MVGLLTVDENGAAVNLVVEATAPCGPIEGAGMAVAEVLTISAAVVDAITA